MWKAGIGTEEHKLYFGNVNPPPLIGTQADTFYLPGELAEGTTYYWRVNEINANGETIGVLWNFTTNIDTRNKLVGHWAMESVFTLADSSFFGNTGSYTGFLPFSSTIEGAINKAVPFNGSSQYGKVSHNSIFDFSTGGFTVSLWLKQDPATISGTKDFPCLLKGTHIGSAAAGTSGKRYEVYFDGGTQTMRFEIDDNSHYSAVSGDGSLFLTGNWVHITGIRDTINDQIHLYRNGVRINTASDLSGDISEEEDLYFAYGADYPTYLPGALDDIRLYNYILTDEEILELYRMGPLGNRLPERSATELSLYPNPTSGSFVVSWFSNTDDAVCIELLNTLGQQERILFQGLSLNGWNKLSLETNGVPAGYYFLRLKTDHEIVTRPILIR